VVERPQKRGQQQEAAMLSQTPASNPQSFHPNTSHSDTPTPNTYLFPHERLQAWRQARGFYLFCAQLQGLPRASGHAGDQLERAALSVLLNLVEGAGRTSWKEKRHFFSISLGSLAEAVAVVDVAATRGLIEGDQAERAIAAGRKVGSMLAGLLKVQGP
jgi:four helix bundle protein